MEAPGIEALWRVVGFDGSQYVSAAQRPKTRRSVKGARTRGSVSIGDDAPDCSNCSKGISQAIAALENGDVGPAKTLLNELAVAARALEQEEESK